MRILYFSYVELDMPNACRTHTLGIIKGFARQRCRVDAMIPKPIKEVTRIPNVRFIFLRPWQFSHIGSFWARLMSGAVMVWLCLTNKYDFIYIRELEINPGPRWCARLFKLPFFIEINDLLVLTYSDKGVNKWLVNMVSRNQRKDFHLATGLIVPSVPMSNWIIKRYNLNPRKVHFIPNGADSPNKEPLKKIDAREQLKMPLNCFCVGFVGNIYDRYDFETLLKAIVICRSKAREIFLLIVGDGPLKRPLQKKVEKYGLGSSSVFTGFVDPELLGNYVPAMDVGVIILDKEIARRYGPLNTKSSTYGIFKIPVIVSSLSLVGYQKKIMNSLFFTKPESPEALADMIIQLHDDPYEKKRKANMFHSLVKSKMTWDVCAIQILHIVHKEISSRSLIL